MFGPRLLPLLVVVLCLAACGQKGPLRLPEADSTASAIPPANDIATRQH